MESSGQAVEHVDGQEGCPHCYYESSGQLCARADCPAGACSPCDDERFYATHPLEAAERDAEEAEAAALWAYEHGWSDWRQYAARAEAAAWDVEQLREEAAEREQT
jgi:hypothetical protein